MKPEVLVAGLIAMTIFATLAARTGSPRREVLKSVAPGGTAFVGVFLVSGLPANLQFVAVVGVVVVAFLASVVRGYMRAGPNGIGPGGP
jgi:hypothetical protein